MRPRLLRPPADNHGNNSRKDCHIQGMNLLSNLAANQLSPKAIHQPYVCQSVNAIDLLCPSITCKSQKPVVLMQLPTILSIIATNRRPLLSTLPQRSSAPLLAVDEHPTASYAPGVRLPWLGLPSIVFPLRKDSIPPHSAFCSLASWYYSVAV